MRSLTSAPTALLGVALVLCLATPALADGSSADEVFWRINEARAERGLEPLARFPDASQVQVANDDYARTGEAHRLGRQNMEHYADLGATGYGENQGMGSDGFSPRRVVGSWMDSPGHAANLFSGSATHLVVAAASGGGATHYTAHLITAPSVDASDPGPQPSTDPPPPSPDGEAADQEGAVQGSPSTGASDAPDASAGDEPSATASSPDAETGQDDDASSDHGWEPTPVDPEQLARTNELDMAVEHDGQHGPDGSASPTAERDPGEVREAHDGGSTAVEPPLASADAAGTASDDVTSPWLVRGAVALAVLGLLAGLPAARRRRRQRWASPRRSRTPCGRSRHAVRNQLVAPEYPARRVPVHGVDHDGHGPDGERGHAAPARPQPLDGGPPTP